MALALLAAGCADTELPSVSIEAPSGPVAGHVINDAGFPVRQAAVSVLGGPISNVTGSAGGFLLHGVDVGKQRLRIDHADYLPLETDVVIRAGNTSYVNATLVPDDKVGAGYREHSHDLWGDARSMEVMSGKPVKFEVSSWALNGGVGEQCKYEVNFPTFVRFDDPSQTMLPGTARFDVRVQWTAQDWAADEVRFGWRPPSEELEYDSVALTSGKTHAVSVNPYDWDSGHQTRTLWRFQLCLSGRPSLPDPPPTGSFRVFMTIHRIEGAIPPERAHPMFWQEGPVRPVIENRLIDFEGIGTSAYKHQQVPDDASLVPPGTAELWARVDWNYSLQTRPVEFTLAARPANEEPVGGKFREMEMTLNQPLAREFRLKVEPGWHDAYYQQRSEWAFHISWKDYQPNVTPCLCNVEVKLNVRALQDDAYLEK